MVASREEIHVQRLKSLAMAWVERLPRHGWSGTPTELADELAALATERRFYVSPPLARGVTDLFALASHEIAAAGWQWGTRRTKAARLIEFVKVPRSSRKK